MMRVSREVSHRRVIRLESQVNLSREAKLVCGITLLAVPTIMYGGITLLGILTRGIAGSSPGALALDDTQWALWRAGHALWR